MAHHIGRRVVDGTIPEGTFLPREAELAQHHGVSRQAVREALKVLAAKGLVVSRRRTGTRVQPRAQWNLLDPDVLAWHPPERLPPDFVRDLAELRRAIEPLAAEMAAARATEEQVEEMRRCLEAMRATIENREAFIEADVSFHTAVAAASGNLLFDRLGAMYQPLLGASFALQGKLRSREMVISATLPQHTAVFEAIAARDTKAARDTMAALVEAAGVEVSRIPWDRLTDSAAGSP